MHHKVTTGALSKKNQCLKLRPGVFSDPANLVANYHEELKKKCRTQQQTTENSTRRDKFTGSSFDNLQKGSTSVSSENELMMDPNFENYEEDYFLSNEFNGMTRPLEERGNKPTNRLSLGEKAANIRSEKALNQESRINLKRQTSVSSLQRRTSSKNLDYENRTPTGIENRENFSNPLRPDVPKVSKPKAGMSFIQEDSRQCKEYNFGRTRSLGKITPQFERQDFRTVETSMFSQVQDTSENDKLESLAKDNLELWMSIKKLSIELQNEQNKCQMFENEINGLNANIAEERAKYQEEFIKISQEIKKFQNMQNLYLQEKKLTQTLEVQLKNQERSIKELSCFISETLQTLMKVLEITILKGDVAFEKQLRSQEFCTEDLFKFLHDLKKPILQKLETAEKQKFKFEWKTNDYEQLIKYSKEIDQLRRAQNFKIQQPSVEENIRRSSISGSSNYNNKQLPNNIPHQFNSIRNQSNPRSTRNSYRSNDRSLVLQNQDLNKSDISHRDSQQKEDKYIPLNCRINLSDFNLQQNNVQANNTFNKEEGTEIYIENVIGKGIVPISRSRDLEFVPYQFTQIEAGNITSNSGNNANKTFDDLLTEGLTHAQVEEKFIQDVDLKQYDVSLPTQDNQLNDPLSYGLNQNQNELDSIKNKIITRMSNIEARRRSSTDGIKQFIDMNKRTTQEFGYQDFTQRGITEKSNEETTPRTRVMALETNRGEENLQENEEIANYKEKIKSLEQSENKSPGSVKAISLSPAPKLNLMAYNTTEDQFVTLTRLDSGITPFSHHESLHITGKDIEQDIFTTKGEYRSIYDRIPESKPEKQESVGFNEYAIANYGYEAQKENDLTFNQGDKIQILKKTSNGWWIGLCRNRIGYFPSNFVTVIEEKN